MIQKQYRKIEIIIVLLMVIGFIGAFCSQLYFAFYNRNPKELRELSMIKYALDFSNGINPYSFNILEEKNPSNIGCYGFIVPLFLSLILRFFSDKYALLVAEVITSFVSALGAVFAYKSLRIRKVRYLLSVYGAIVFYLFQLLCGGLYSTAFPGQWGMSVASFCTYIILKDDEKEKYHPVSYALIIILLFYIKQYYVFIGISLYIFLLFRSKYDAKKYMFSGGILGILSMILVNWLFPIYFSLTIARASLDSVMKPISYAVGQFHFLLTYKRFLPVLIGVACIGYFVVKALVFGTKKLFKRNIAFELISLITIILPTTYIARNGGQNLEYILQLWMPYYLLVGCLGLEIVLKNFEDKKYGVVIKYTVYAIVILCSFSTLKLECINPFSAKEREVVENWNKAYEIIEKKSPNGIIIVPPHLSQYCLVHGIYTDDYGQSEYMSESALERYNDNKLFGSLFPWLGDLISINIAYNESVQKGIDNGLYEVVVLKEGEGPHTTETLTMSDYYIEVDTIDLYTGDQKWKTHFWVRNNVEVKAR